MSTFAARTAQEGRIKLNPAILFLAPLYSWRAAAGARLMDQKSPGWYLKIDKEILDFTDDDACIIGQAVGNFTRHRNEILGGGGIFSSPMVSYGFCAGWMNAASGLFKEFVLDAYGPPSSARLKRAWCYQIDRRLAAAH